MKTLAHGKMFEKKLILDTCALLWLAGGSNNLSKNVLDSIENASIVYVSAISAWEISLKTARGLMELPMDTEKWFRSVLEFHNLTLALVAFEQAGGGRRGGRGAVE